MTEKSEQRHQAQCHASMDDGGDDANDSYLFSLAKPEHSIGEMKLLRWLFFGVMMAAMVVVVRVPVSGRDATSSFFVCLFFLFLVFRYKTRTCGGAHSSLDLLNNGKTMEANEIRQEKFIDFTVSLTWKCRSNSTPGIRNEHNIFPWCFVVDAVVGAHVEGGEFPAIVALKLIQQTKRRALMRTPTPNLLSVLSDIANFYIYIFFSCSVRLRGPFSIQVFTVIGSMLSPNTDFMLIYFCRTRGTGRPNIFFRSGWMLCVCVWTAYGNI